MNLFGSNDAKGGSNRNQSTNDSDVAEAIADASHALMKFQNSCTGHFCGELHSNASATAQYVFLHTFLGDIPKSRQTAVRSYFHATQGADGGWPLYSGGNGDLSTTVEAYLALRLCGESRSSEVMTKAKSMIHELGGAERARSFTKLHLALLGQCDWRDVPKLPLVLALSPALSRQIACWARICAMPLVIIFAKRPTCNLSSLSSVVSELFLTQTKALQKEERSPATKIARSLSAIGRRCLHPVQVLRAVFIDAALRAAERWVIDHQESTGDFGGIFPGMAYAIIALVALGYPKRHTTIIRALEAIERFAIEEENQFRVQMTVSPVWDTALSIMALTDANRAVTTTEQPSISLSLPTSRGLNQGHAVQSFEVHDNKFPEIVRSVNWLLDRQTTTLGDGTRKRFTDRSGGWSMQFNNSYYPDLDCTAAAVIAIKRARTDDGERGEWALQRGLSWICSKQERDGGFAAFGVHNKLSVFNKLRFADHRAMLDRSCPDVTGRVLQALCEAGCSAEHPTVCRALSYLRQRQEHDGSWFGRWGICYLYGTGQVLAGLGALGLKSDSPEAFRAVLWLESVQNSDGGWGEDPQADRDPAFRGRGASTASQTAWALLGLIAIGRADTPAVARGITWLLEKRQPGSGWEESAYTGAGFPGFVYFRYRLYSAHFPLAALARYQTAMRSGALT